MPVSYELAGDETNDLIAETMLNYHNELYCEDVTVTGLFANNGYDPAVKQNGYPVVAKIKVTNLEQRVQGLSDAIIVIDRRCWKDLNKKQQIALIDSELEHLELSIKERLDKETGDFTRIVKKDDHGRPKLKIKKFDYMSGGFFASWEKHGENCPAAMEMRQLMVHLEPFRQLLMPWGDDMAGPTESEADGNANAAAKKLRKAKS